MDKPYYLAIDIGASSGRHIVGWREDGEIHTQEVYRFSNAVMERNGHLVWDMERLEREVRIGIDAALALFADIESLSIDTWGFDGELMERLGLPAYLFPKLQRPGMVIGEYKGIKVTLCATHDTASAVEGIPMEGSQPYLSSGTWSLLGVKTKKPLTDERSRAANYSNEGGVGYNRYQKNIMGMWLVQELRKELCPGRDYDAIVQEAEQSRYEGVVDVNSPEFLSPVSMKAAFDAALPGKPQKAADYFCCAYRSLAVSYQSALAELEQNTGCTCEMLYIVGGGAKNRFLNRLTEETTGKVVVALPMEATALGNLKIQMEANL